MNENRQTQTLLCQIGHGVRPSEDAVADALLLFAVRNDALTPDEAGELQEWDLPTDGPKTLNGLIVELLETIPAPGTCLKVNGYPIEIMETDDNRVRTARVGQREAGIVEE